MNKKKLYTILFSLFFMLSLSVAEQSFASEYSTEYPERMTGVDGANISQNADPNLETVGNMGNTGTTDSTVFDDDGDDKEDSEEDGDDLEEDDDLEEYTSGDTV